ncbi:STAS domain-containing protein [Thiohalocapsa marina]|uniref:Anti-sigma factor antagonist n=1 Tax=Thiohalocapsa marina TaxID=424902 RepID=A0A5M8FVD8_9GAMM|nr:STAS domain-containing protein [Thiohalocapsa marina]KAA6187755.1 STAS domain-containing protein [Thiohalocapsa marina]
MNVSEEKIDNALVLKVSGRIDSSTAPDLQTHLMDCIGRAPTILIDLAETDYMSSAGLRVILMGAKTCKKDARQFGLCCLQESVHEVFEISGFLSIIQAFATREEALQALAG